MDFTPWLGSPTPDPCSGPVHLDIGSNGVSDFDFPTIQGAVNAASNGDTVRVDPGTYAEVVSTVSSRSAGPGTRQNIDEFTRKTGDGLRTIGGAERGKAIIILNPAEPPIMMRNTVYCALSEGYDEEAVTASIEQMIAAVAAYVPGYRLKSPPLFDAGPFPTPGGTAAARVTVLLEVEGAGDYFPPYAGNLDIMTASAVRVGETLAAKRLGTEVLA